MKQKLKTHFLWSFVKKIRTFFLLMVFILITVQGALSQNLSVSGIVKNSAGEPIPGVTIVVKGTMNGTITDLDGNYTLSNVKQGDVLSFSYVGMLTEDVVVSNQTSIDMTLVEDIKSLDEVVVVGYGTQRKGEVTVAVSQVKGEDMESISKTNFIESLGGRVAGVDVVSTSGAPGSGGTIRIRGANSVNSGTDPLYVIDGFPVAATMDDIFTDSRLGISSDQTDLLSMIDPNNIESIEILKDAAATSIYGARGANGVVIITTKTGHAGKTEISVSVNTGIQQVAKTYEMMNSTEFSQLLYDAYERGGIDMENLAYDPSNGLAIPVDYNTDWQDEIMRTAKVQDYNVSFSGGNKNSKYSGSIGYLNNEGILSSNYYKRYTARLKADTKAWQDKITIGLNSNFSYVDQKSVSGAVADSLALITAPNYPVRFPEGTTYAGYYTHSETTDAYDVLWGDSYGCASSAALTSFSPFYYLDLAQAPSNQTRLISDAYMSFEPIKGLVFKSSFGVDLNYNKIKYLVESAGPVRVTGGSLEHSQSQSYSWVSENTINYSKEINSHSFNVLLGQSGQKFYTEAMWFAVEEYSPGEILIANNPFFVDGWNFDYGVEDNLSTNAKGASTSEWTVASYFGRFNYSFDGKYLLTATLRRDGSSKFGSGNKWGNFPGVSVAWNMDREDFFNLSFVDRLKIRGSWGIVGNGDIDSYLSQSLMTSSLSTFVGVISEGTATFESALADPDLSWESTREFDFGFDAYMYDRFTVTGDVYFKKTYDLLYPMSLPASTGWTEIQMTNFGSINQFGLELSLSGDIIKAKTEGGFNWFGSLNFDHLQGKVTELPDGVDWVGSSIRSYVDEPIGEIYGYKTDGIYNTQEELDNGTYSSAQIGDYRYVDLGSTDDNGNYVEESDGNITSADRTKLGNVQPVVSIGFNSVFSYKNFDLNMMFKSSIGNKIYNKARQSLLNTDGNTNLLKEAANRWTEENHNQTIQAANSNRSDPTGGSAPLDIYVEDGSYLKMSNLILGYTLPRSVIDYVGISSLRIYGSINNVFVLTGYSGLDPEISGGGSLVIRGVDETTYPKTRSYTVGLNIKF